MSSSATGVGMPICFLGAILLILTQKSSQIFGDVLGIMVSKDTPKSDKLMILSTISYLILPVDLISAKRLPIIGWIDEAFSLSVVYQKVSKNITPEIERKTDALLDKWFPEYTNYIEVID